MAALHWIAQGHGYDITSADVLDAYTSLIQAAQRARLDIKGINDQIREMASGSQPGSRLVRANLDRHLSS
jgi:hypothetical protein